MKKRVVYQVPGSSGQKLRFVTKEMAALHFLGSIAMEHEEAIRKGGFALPSQGNNIETSRNVGETKTVVSDAETVKVFKDLEAVSASMTIIH